MRHPFNFKAVVFLSLFLLACPQWILSDVAAATSKKHEYNLETCTDRKLGVKFLCDKSWKIRTVDDAILIVVSSDPAVTLTIAKIDPNMLYLSQLTQKDLVNKQLYKDGFRTERTKLGDRDSLVVKAFSRKNNERRVLDYFFIHDSSLYGMLFSVQPKEKWDGYKFLIKDIVESLKFYGD